MITSAAMPSPLNCPDGARVLLGNAHGPYSAMTIIEWSMCNQFFNAKHEDFAAPHWYEARKWFFHARLHQPSEIP